MAGSGSVEAMYALAERRLQDDPLDALSWYDQAISAGSVYAMLKTADLLENIADPQVQALLDSPQWARALITLQRDTVQPLEKALAWSLAASIAGGESMLTHQHAGRLARLIDKLNPGDALRACERAQSYVLETATLIRNSGRDALSLEQPPLALTAAFSSVWPCDSTVQPLIDLEGCDNVPVVTPSQEPGSLWICPYSST